MYATIDEARQHYIKNFTDFVMWLYEFEENASAKGIKFIPMEHLDKRNWEKYINRSAQLVGMEKVLGFTELEVKNVVIQLGLDTKKR